MNLTDATIAPLLAAKIHSKGSAVKATAKRCSQLLPRSKRDLMFTVMKLIDHIAQYKLSASANGAGRHCRTRSGLTGHPAIGPTV